MSDSDWHRPDAPAADFGPVQPPGPPPQPMPPQAPPAWMEAPRPGVVPLRPLGLSDILDSAITTIRRYPKVMIGIGLLVVTISQFIAIPLQWLAGDFDFPAPGQTPADPAYGSVGTLAAVAVGGLAATVLTGFLAPVVGKAVLGRPVTFRTAWAEVKPSLLRLLGLMVIINAALGGVWLVAGLSIFGLALALDAWAVLPGVIIGAVAVVLFVWLWVGFALAPPALVLERCGPIEAVQRSFRLIRGSWWRIFGIRLLAYLIATIIVAIVQCPFAFLGGFGAFAAEADFRTIFLALVVATVAGTIIAASITEPFYSGVAALQYTDQRIRKEGLDIELARSAGLQPRQP